MISNTHTHTRWSAAASCGILCQPRRSIYHYTTNAINNNTQRLARPCGRQLWAPQHRANPRLAVHISALDVCVGHISLGSFILVRTVCVCACITPYIILLLYTPFRVLHAPPPFIGLYHTYATYIRREGQQQLLLTVNCRWAID